MLGCTQRQGVPRNTTKPAFLTTTSPSLRLIPPGTGTRIAFGAARSCMFSRNWPHEPYGASPDVVQRPCRPDPSFGSKRSRREPPPDCPRCDTCMECLLYTSDAADE